MDYRNLWCLQWWRAVFQPVVCHHVLLDSLFDSSDDNYVQNYDVGRFNNETDRLVLIDTRTPAMIKVTE